MTPPKQRSGRVPPADMVRVAGGELLMGSNRHYPEEAPARIVMVDGFWMDPHPVTNAQFGAFVVATGYRTVAEISPDPTDYPDAPAENLFGGSIVFVQPDRPVELSNWPAWWTFLKGADWRHPYGEGSSIAGLEDHPVVHVAYADAAAFADWAHKKLPSEAEWEFASRGGLRGAEYAWGDEQMPQDRAMANYWRGNFPVSRLGPDSQGRTSAVMSFPANGYGLYDMIGNVWEWTADAYDAHETGDRSQQLNHCCAPKNNRGGASPDSTPREMARHRKVLKGGSHLCAENYCFRFRPAARLAQSVDTSTSHVGFRCIARSC